MTATPCALVLVVTTGVTWWLDDPRRAADAGLYEEQAYRLATTGEFVRPQEEGAWSSEIPSFATQTLVGSGSLQAG